MTEYIFKEQKWLFIEKWLLDQPEGEEFNLILYNHAVEYYVGLTAGVYLYLML